MESPQGCFGDTVVTEFILWETEMEARDGPKERRDGDATQLELNEW